MEVYVQNKRKVDRVCLKCGRKFLTDRCHRICRKCTKENYDVVPVNKQSLLRGSEYFYNDWDMD
jgi:Zn finger protein HypA/HybF involved in hydrogenase expression